MLPGSDWATGRTALGMRRLGQPTLSDSHSGSGRLGAAEATEVGRRTHVVVPIRLLGGISKGLRHTRSRLEATRVSQGGNWWQFPGCYSRGRSTKRSDDASPGSALASPTARKTNFEMCIEGDRGRSRVEKPSTAKKNAVGSWPSDVRGPGMLHCVSFCWVANRAAGGLIG